MEKRSKEAAYLVFMGLDECYANIIGQILLMNPMPTIAKAYNMIRQEEKQREGFALKFSVSAALSAHSNNYRNFHNNGFNNGGRNRWNYSGNYSQGEYSTRNSVNNGNATRRIVFEKGIIYGDCGKEGHTKEEYYQLVGYPDGHPLHGKFKPPNTPQRTVNTSMGQNVNAVNMSMGPKVNAKSVNTYSQQSEVAMCARMDQLQNQLNQMMLMMQNNKDSFGMSSEDIPKLIAAFTTTRYRFIAFHITNRKYNIIASILVNQKYLWVVDSGATDDVCYSLTLMHNI
nr:cysteine-rich RLK (receptor-like protein kinase) 8 [Tanacetum cinerariifolium]